MQVKPRLVTAEEFLEMPDIPGKHVELVDAEVVEVPPAGAEHTGVMCMLAKRLNAFVGQYRLGIVMPDGLGFVIRRDPDLARMPDVSFIETANVSSARAAWPSPVACHLQQG